MKNKFLTALFSTSLVAGLSCSSLRVETYKDEKPVLRLEDFFSGTIDAYGVFTDRGGIVKKRFHAKIACAWQGNVGTLDETFTYSDGTTSKRIWTLKREASGDYTATAPDVVGVAKGSVAGNAFNLTYTLALDVDGTTYHVSMDDWMYLMNDKIMLNKTRMTKFGFHLGDVTLSFVKP